MRVVRRVGRRVGCALVSRRAGLDRRRSPSRNVVRGETKKRVRRRFVKPAPRDRGGSEKRKKWRAFPRQVAGGCVEGSYLAELGGARGGGHREGGGGGDGGSLVDCDARGVGIRVSVVARS
jgi:hypothetical protein